MDESGEPLALSAQLGAVLYVCVREKLKSQSTYKMGSLYLAKDMFHGNANKLLKIFVYGKYTDSFVPFD